MGAVKTKERTSASRTSKTLRDLITVPGTVPHFVPVVEEEYVWGLYPSKKERFGSSSPDHLYGIYGLIQPSDVHLCDPDTQAIWEKAVKVEKS